MSGGEYYPEASVHQHHGIVAGAREPADDFGVPDHAVAGMRKGLLGNRCGDDAVHFAEQGQLDCLFNGLSGRPSGTERRLAHRRSS